MSTYDICTNVWRPFIHNIQGAGKERRITLISLSETLQRLDIDKCAVSTGGFRYCADFLRCMLSLGLRKISGTAQKQVFTLIESMLNEALTHEVNIPSMRKLLRSAMAALENGEFDRIGSIRLWTKHKEMITNSLIRLDNFEIKGRMEDGKPEFLDLPKECIYNIVSRLSNPQDIANLGKSCSFLNVICEDSLLWQQLCFLHFSDKQTASMIDDEFEFSDIDWKTVFYLCKGRYQLKIREVYGDELVLCDHCRKLYWRIHGHPCNSPELPPSLTVISPKEFVDMLRL